MATLSSDTRRRGIKAGLRFIGSIVARTVAGEDLDTLGFEGVNLLVLHPQRVIGGEDADTQEGSAGDVWR